MSLHSQSDSDSSVRMNFIFKIEKSFELRIYFKIVLLKTCFVTFFYIFPELLSQSKKV